MTVVTRDATIDDVDRLVALNARLMQVHLQFDEYYRRHPHSLEVYGDYFRRLIDEEKGRVLIALDGETIVGFIAGKIEHRPPVFAITEKGEINSVFVTTPHRRRGIGGQLLRRMLNWFTEQGIEYVELSVDVKNTASANVWRSHGFEPWQLVMNRRAGAR